MHILSSAHKLFVLCIYCMHFYFSYRWSILISVIRIGMMVCVWVQKYFHYILYVYKIIGKLLTINNSSLNIAWTVIICVLKKQHLFCYLLENKYLKQWRIGWQHYCHGFDNKGEVFMQIMLININDMMHFAKLSWMAIINTKTRYLTSHIHTSIL